MKSKEKKRNQR